MSRYQVRCCCDPTKIIGTVEADKPILFQKYHFRIGPPKFTLYPLGETRQDSIDLEFAEVYEGWNISTKAFKSHDLPLERLKQIPSFKEVT